jgi:hypothetical protein
VLQVPSDVIDVPSSYSCDLGGVATTIHKFKDAKPLLRLGEDKTPAGDEFL